MTMLDGGSLVYRNYGIFWPRMLTVGFFSPKTEIGGNIEFSDSK